MSGISYSGDVSHHQDASMMENSSFWTGLEYGSALVYELLVHLIEFKFFVLLCSKFFRVQLSSDVFSFQLFLNTSLLIDHWANSATLIFAASLALCLMMEEDAKKQLKLVEKPVEAK